MSFAPRVRDRRVRALRTPRRLVRAWAAVGAALLLAALGWRVRARHRRPAVHGRTVRAIKNVPREQTLHTDTPLPHNASYGAQNFIATSVQQRSSLNSAFAPGIDVAHAAQATVLAHVLERLAWERPKACVPDVHRPARNTHCHASFAHDTGFCSTPCPLTLAELQHACAGSLQIHTSMENDGTCVRGDARTICMSVDSRADVHMQYFAWQDFKLARPANESALGFLASFVSNCKSWRVSFLQALAGALRAREKEVHHYGGCLHNARSPYAHVAKYKEKDALATQHRYVFSFENSETPGYVTEKLFYMLSAGAVPVYRGAPDVWRVLPAREAAVVVPADMMPAQLAGVLMHEDDEQYAARRAWRSEPLQPKFVANLDYAVWHSTCRACVRLRSMELPVRRDGLWVREQGFVDFVRVPEACTHRDTVGWLLCIAALIEQGLPAYERALRPRGAGAVVLVYRAWDREKCEVTDVARARALPGGAELEVVMQNPGWRRRGTAR
tara:strand:- start:12494 stop:13993 length:1500 start_codon:yes stop_codon:yes gene_type:complete